MRRSTQIIEIDRIVITGVNAANLSPERLRRLIAAEIHSSVAGPTAEYPKTVSNDRQIAKAIAHHVSNAGASSAE